ncbi:hypothetical protein RB195_024791 [Necator americanus]|uniref:Uncharacterized protein n=1 Tax=Necator americanus TaxID=51031 RepID=A0ABR1EPN1_NECAM
MKPGETITVEKYCKGQNALKHPTSSPSAHCFEPVRSASDFAIGTLHIRDDCLDMSTESVHKSFEHFYPTISIFGPESIVLKSLVVENSCEPLRPQFPRPAATAHYVYPIVGRLVLVDMDDRILLTGELRQTRKSTATRATVQEAVIEDLMMQAKKIKYDVIGLTETRRRHPLNAVYETGEELF